MEEFFISDEEVARYEKKSDPARRSVRWSLAAVAAAFVLIGGAYALGYFGGGDGMLTASLGETFTLWSARSTDSTDGYTDGTENTDGTGTACGYDPVQSRSATVASGQPVSNGAGSGGVLFSEIAWMGTEEGAQYEWIEIANTDNTDGKTDYTDIGGWSVVDKEEQIQFVFPKGASIPADGFILLARSADRVGSAKADYRYTGNLKNEDEGLKLFNVGCDVMDEVLAARPPAGGWPAGEVGERLTMERNLSARLWYTSSKVGGTPKATNSILPLSTSQDKASGEHFEAQNVLVTTSTATTSTQASPTSVEATTVVITEVMAGKDGAANWDFVELHNVGSGAVNLTGWSVKKKTASGSESALVATARLEGKMIPADGYFLLANPDYAGTPVADVVWPKSYTLAYTNNAVVVYDANGGKVDEVVWTEIPKGQSYTGANGIWAPAIPTPGRP